MQGVTGEAPSKCSTAPMSWSAGRSIIHMEIGEPDFDTPAPVVTAGLEWLKKARRITPQSRHPGTAPGGCTASFGTAFRFN